MMSDPTLRFDNACFGYGASRVFEGLNLRIPTGKITAFCGPNGSGKSTALKAMRGLIGLDSGIVALMERPVADWPAKALAREVALLAQNPRAAAEMTVSDLVMLGRFAWTTRFRGTTAADRQAVQQAMQACDLIDLADAPLDRLSGGQIQRAWIALVLAQDAPVLLLDEPTNHLDISHTIEVLDLVAALNRTHGRSVVIVLHDLNLAARYADEVVVFNDGKVFAQGPTRDVFRTETISEAFGIECEIATDPRFGTPHVFAYRKENAVTEGNTRSKEC